MMVSDDGRSEEMYLAGGCYKDGHEVAHYQRAHPDKLYKFEYVPLEVRASADPYLVWASQDYKISKYDSTYILVSYMLMLGAVFFGILSCISYQSSKAKQDPEEKKLNR